MWRSPRRFCRHGVLIRFPARQSFFKKTAMRRGDFPPMCDNAAPRARHRRSVEPALKLLWEVPMVNTRAEAEAAVRACRYHPLGNRSNAGVRGEWGEFKNYRDYLDTVNNGLLIVPMIETNQSLENLDDIASVPGVDVLLIGPSDLSIELGVPLDYSCDTYQRALDKIAAAAAKRGIAAGMYFIPPEMNPNFFVQKGFKFFTMPWVPGRRPGSRTACPESSANDGRRGRS